MKWTYSHLYVILDVFSRYVVGWMVAARESAELAQELIVEACARQNIQPGQLTIHADRGSPMKAKSTALLYGDLGITKSHSRPHVSDDNPFSESHFKTLKYRPELPDRFGSLPDARSLVGPLMHWYNEEHYHSGIALLTPADVHHGRAASIIEARQHVLDAAYAAHPSASFAAPLFTSSRRPRSGSIRPPGRRPRRSRPPRLLRHLWRHRRGYLLSADRSARRPAAPKTIAEPARARTAPPGHEPRALVRPDRHPLNREGAVLAIASPDFSNSLTRPRWCKLRRP
ncbi:MAG: DDE-type integrase/transposase/recombinase [Kofleriaceae bacterium]